MKHYRNKLSVLIAAGATLAASGCNAEFSIGGESIESAGEKLIEGEIAAGLGQELEATCPAVPDAEVGTTFSCTATNPAGEIITFSGVVDVEDHIEVQSTNVIDVDGLASLERSGAELLEPKINATLDIDCGVDLVILPDNKELVCDGADEFGDSAPIIFTITDLEAGTFEVVIGASD